MIAIGAARDVARAQASRGRTPTRRWRDALDVVALYLGGCGERLVIACAIVMNAPARRVRMRSAWARALGELALADRHTRAL